MCRSKLKIVKQLSKYILPQTKTIIVCIILSLITTALSLVPPTVTGFIVDVVFSGGESSVGVLNLIASFVGEDQLRLLFTMIACLLFTYIFQYGIGIIKSYPDAVLPDSRCVHSYRNENLFEKDSPVLQADMAPLVKRFCNAFGYDTLYKGRKILHG